MNVTPLPSWDALVPFADHLWQSTVVLLLAALLTLAFRNNRAHVRHALWLAASAKFLVPFAPLVALGRELGWPWPRVAEVERMLVLGPGSEPLIPLDLSLQAALSDSSALAAALPGALLIVWLGGCAIVLLSWWARWRRVASVIAAAASVEDGPVFATLRRLEQKDALPRGRRRPSGLLEIPLALVSADTTLEPGVFGVLKPVLLWPRTIEQRLDAAHVEAILAHELCHVRRRDNMTAAVHMLVQALFWFHPLVWWVGKRLVDERERACDEAVVRQGSEPDVYAESILRTCRFYVESPLACAAGVTGADLKRRVERIMRPDSGAVLGAWKKGLLTAMGMMAVCTPVVAGALTGRGDVVFVRERVRVRAAPAQAGAAGGPTFEVASVRVNRAREGRVMLALPPGGRLTATNVRLRELIQQAYQLRDYQIIGLPEWIDSARFDVEAKAEGDVAAAPPGAGGPMQLMLQALLTERFRLKAHAETRDLPIYSLVLARSDGRLGPQLRPSGVECAPVTFPGGMATPPPPPPAPPGGVQQGCPGVVAPWFIGGRRMTIARLAGSLAALVRRPVFDRTGLDGDFDLDLTYAPDQTPAGQPVRFNGVELDLDAPSIFTALQEQLGLELEAGRGPVDVLVIESVEQPTEN
ncbi:MAG: TIGR03435 family protein [Acidobacteria bacterium]|nr:TIGR03435 family protein [Acidobacteriota bacterium]